MVSVRSARSLKEQGSAVQITRPAKRKVSEKVVDILLERQKRERTASRVSQAEREKLILEFRMKARKLGRSILRKWHARLDLAEVDSVVDLSLCEAVRRYDPEKGASFMTFLFYHLRGNLIRAVSSAANANAIPVYEEEESNQEIVEGKKKVTGVSAMEVAEALCGDESVAPDEALFKKELIEISTQACRKLDALEREVIERIYLQEEQLMDIASSLGYSRCHISRVKKKALENLQSVMSNTLHVEQQLAESHRGSRSMGARRAIHRRRPRSLRALQVHMNPLPEKIAAVG